MKKFLFLLATLLSVASVHAQDDGLGYGDDGEIIKVTSYESSAFYIGPKIGLNMSTMTQPQESKLYDGAGIGFSGGLALRGRFGKITENSSAGTGYLGAGLELKYKQNTVKTIGINEDGETDANLSLDYFDVPVYVQLYPLAMSSGLNSFYIEAGASFGALVSRSPKSLTVENPNDYMSSVTYNLDTPSSQLKGMAVSPLVGIGYTLPSGGLDINARYYIGITELAGNFPCKMSSFEISLSWMFNMFNY